MANISDTSATGRREPKIELDRLEFRSLSPECERGDFSCGYIHIDDFFNRLSLNEHETLHSRVTTVHLDGSNNPVGFYSAQIKVEPEDEFEREKSVFEKIQSKLFNKSLLTFHLNWLGVRTKLQRRGIGSFLLMNAIDNFYEISHRSGICAMTLKPISSNAEIFYQKLGFVSYGAGPLRPMFLSAKSVMDARKNSLDNNPPDPR